jgi:pimeloyl-ACP methyl ester carboxylesterase
VAARDVTLAACGEAVRDDIVANDLRDVVLVGHSLAGVTVPRVVELVPERIRHIVLVSATVPPHGASVLDTIDPDVRKLVEAAFVDGLYSQTREASRLMLCNDLSDEQAEWALDRVIDDSAQLITEPVDLTGYSRGVPTTYLRLDLDQTVPPSVQAEYQARARATPIHVQAGHMVMVGQPARVAEILNGIDRPG